MLVMPRRSVTRFFIPLIDVLTLLFCVFLVMPLAKSSNEDVSSSAEDVKRLQAELDRLRGLGADEPERLRKELEELRTAKSTTLMNRILVQVLEIDGKTGELVYRGDRGPVAIKSESDLKQKLEEDRRRAAGRQEVVYQILYPPDPESRLPTAGQRRIIEGWLVNNMVAYKFVNPAASEKEQ